MLHQIVPWTIETILCITSVIRPRLQFFEMGVSLVSVCILLWDILHASFGEGADLSDVFMRSILCWCCSVSFYLFFLCHLFFFPSPPSSSWGPLSPGVCQESPWPFPHLLSLESGSRNRQKTQVFACECKHSCIVPPKYHLHLDDYSLSFSLSLSLSLSFFLCSFSLSLSLSSLCRSFGEHSHTLGLSIHRMVM